jgi:cyanophycinase-like exopeptidase
MNLSAGMLALVGAGEFLQAMRPVDADLLQRSGGRRVVVLPTASAPDGAEVAASWARRGVEHFTALGAQVEAVMALDREGCEMPANVARVRQSNLVYFSGGKPDYLLHTLRGTSLWTAVLSVLERGGVLAGCSAGAMMLGGWIPARPATGSLSIWLPAFSLVPNSVILPHFDEIPRWITTPLGWLRPRRSRLIGVDGGTALVGPAASGAGGWQVLGTGRVVLRWAGQSREHRMGDAVRLAA